MPLFNRCSSTRNYIAALEAKNAELTAQRADMRIEQSMWRQREQALLELLDHYWSEIVRLQQPVNTQKPENPEIIVTSASDDSGSDNSLQEAAAFPIAETNFRLAITESEIDSFGTALKSIVHRSASTFRKIIGNPTVRVFIRRRHLRLHSAAIKKLENAESEIHGFLSQVRILRNLCVASQDSLSAAQDHLFRSHATLAYNKLSTLPTSNVPHPLELTFRFHRLPSALSLLCRRAGCLGAEDPTCIHKLNPDLNALMAVTVVHPGSSYEALKYYLLGAIKGATQLQGESFILSLHAAVTVGGVKVDGETWERVFADTTVAEVGWAEADIGQNLEGDEPLPLVEEIEVNRIRSSILAPEAEWAEADIGRNSEGDEAVPLIENINTETNRRRSFIPVSSPDLWLLAAGNIDINRRRSFIPVPSANTLPPMEKKTTNPRRSFIPVPQNLDKGKGKQPAVVNQVNKKPIQKNKRGERECGCHTKRH
ncbi:hypothetical protein RUND412_002614 [Rhizina undulata]